MNVSIFVFVAHINYPGLWVISSNVERVPEVASRQWLHRIKSVGLFCLFDKLWTSIQRYFKGRARSLVYLLKKIKGFLVIWVRVRIWQPLTGNESQFVMVPSTPLWTPDMQATCQVSLSPWTVFLVGGKHFSGKAEEHSDFGHVEPHRQASDTSYATYPPLPTSATRGRLLCETASSSARWRSRWNLQGRSNASMN